MGRALFRSRFYNLINHLYAVVHPAILVHRAARLNGPIIWMIHPEARVIIGAGVRVNSGLGVNPLGAFRRSVLYASRGAVINICAGAGISSSTIAAQKGVTLEDHVMVGANCTIIDSDFHALPKATFPDVICREVVLKRGCFVGANCTLLKGSSIGENSILGAGSVLAGVAGPNEVWGGAPARRLKSVA